MMNEDKHKSILDYIVDGYFEVDLSGSFTFINDSLCKIIGYTKDELLGMNYKQYMSRETVKKVFKIFNEVYKTGKTAKYYDWEIQIKATREPKKGNGLPSRIFARWKVAGVRMRS